MSRPHFGSRTISTPTRFLALRTRIATGVPLIGDESDLDVSVIRNHACQPKPKTGHTSGGFSPVETTRRASLHEIEERNGRKVQAGAKAEVARLGETPNGSFTDRFRQPDILRIGNSNYRCTEIHGFASLLHSRFALIVQSLNNLQKIRAALSLSENDSQHFD